MGNTCYQPSPIRRQYDTRILISDGYATAPRIYLEVEVSLFDQLNTGIYGAYDASSDSVAMANASSIACSHVNPRPASQAVVNAATSSCVRNAAISRS
jgi:hypothetical protein